MKPLLFLLGSIVVVECGVIENPPELRGKWVQYVRDEDTGKVTEEVDPSCYKVPKYEPKKTWTPKEKP